MADNISSASTSNVVPAAQHSKAVAALVEAWDKIETLEAEAIKLWTGHEVLFVLIVSFVTGFFVRGL